MTAQNIDLLNLAQTVDAAELVDMTETQTRLIGEVKTAIIAGFNTTVQKLLDTPTATLGDVQKADKRYWQQQVGSKMKDLRNALKKRLASDEAGPVSSTMESRLDSVLSDWIKRLEKAEAAGFDLPEMIKRLKYAKSLIK